MHAALFFKLCEVEAEVFVFLSPHAAKILNKKNKMLISISDSAR